MSEGCLLGLVDPMNMKIQPKLIKLVQFYLRQVKSGWTQPNPSFNALVLTFMKFESETWPSDLLPRTLFFPLLGCPFPPLCNILLPVVWHSAAMANCWWCGNVFCGCYTSGTIASLWLFLWIRNALRVWGKKTESNFCFLREEIEE